MEGGRVMTDMSDQVLFHLTPREVYELFDAGVARGEQEYSYWGGVRNLAYNSRKEALVGLMYTHALYRRYQQNDPVHDRDELHRAIEAMFEGIE